MPKILDLAGLLALIHTEDEHTSINTQSPGRAFTSVITPSRQAHELLDQTANCYYGINPIRPDAGGRGRAEDVTRLAALWADLDVKPGGMPTFDAARAVVDVLADMLGTRPTAVTYSGHGLQPIWTLDPDDPTLTLNTNNNRVTATALLRRWGRLVATVAAAHDGQVDSVYDLPRVLRAPGTTNHKNPDNPVPVVAIPDTGHPLDHADVDDTLTAYGVLAQPEDTEQLGETISPPSTWEWADNTCIYAQKMIAGWATDAPTERHPWLVAQATRLAALVRLGCITAHDYQAATRALHDRFTQLLAGAPAREEARGEFHGALAWGRDRIATMPDPRVRREVGDHPHQYEDLILPEHQPPPTTTPAPAPARHLTSVPPPTQGATALTPDPAPTTDPAPSRLPAPNEDNTALILIDRHADELRYCSGRGTWLVWNGHRWSGDDDDHIHELVRSIARHLPEGEGWTTYKKRALSLNGVKGITGLARSDRRILAPINDLDAHPYELNTPTGIVDLRTGAIRPPDPDALHTRSTIIAPDFDQPTPLWDKFLADTFAGDPDMIAFIARALGLSLIGAVLEQVFFFAFGSGANGKSTLMAVMQHITGTGPGGYAGTSPAEMLLATKNRGHPTELARLAGQRLVVTSELDDGQRFDESRIKLLTGKDDISARFMHRDLFDFTPTHTLWLLANHQPQVRVGGMAFWRRVRMIPFVHTVPESERIADLEEQLIEKEGPGILAWVIRGAADYMNGGLREPETVLAATRDYEAGQNTVARFVEEMCEVGNPNAQHMHIRSSQLRAAYEAWCTEEGAEPVAPRSFTLALKSQFGVQTSRSGTARYLDGIRLRDDDDASRDASRDASQPDSDPARWWE